MQRLIASLHAGERLDRPFVQPQEQIAISSPPTIDALKLGGMLMASAVLPRFGVHRSPHLARLVERLPRMRCLQSGSFASLVKINMA